MMAQVVDLSLTGRVQAFGKVLDRSVITLRSGPTETLESGLVTLVAALGRIRSAGNSVFIIGNGGSAAVASHAVNDFVNVAKLRATTIHDPSLLTCMANDYGYENAYARILAQMTRPGDVLIAISSSGKSVNIRNAVNEAARAGATVVTLSGFASDNPLRQMGDINIWLDSSDYGFVEIGHQFMLHNVSDRLGAGHDGA